MPSIFARRFSSPDELNDFVKDFAQRLRDEGFAEAAQQIETVSTTAYTTSSEWMGELGLALRAIETHTLSPDLRRRYDVVVEAVRGVWPAFEIKRAGSTPRRRRYSATRMRWFPDRSRVIAILLAILIVLALSAAVIVGLAVTSTTLTASHAIVLFVASFILVPTLAGSILDPVARAVERRLLGQRRTLVVALVLACLVVVAVPVALVPRAGILDPKHTDAKQAARKLLALAQLELATVGTCHASIERARTTPDPWGTPFVVECEPSPLVRCAGPDRELGTDDDKEWPSHP